MRPLPDKIKISLLMITLDRFDLTRSTWLQNVKNAHVNLPYGWELEFLVADNGSTDQRIIDFFKDEDIRYHRINKKNEGVGHAFNQLYLRSTGDIIVLMGNDLVNPPGWIEEMVRYALRVPDSGIIGIDWGHGGVPPLTEKFGILAHWLTPQLNRVFGTWVFRRGITQRLGFFHNGFGLYGLEDSEFNERVNRAGYNSCYVPNAHFKAQHLGHDVGENTNYRKMKDKALEFNLSVFWPRIEFFDKGGTLVEPLPLLKEPLT